ncbi:hypothetical protein TNCV_4750631 [Trichonephila clavipes]|nr:hypothetical protein TNCV_4750631 [Trichonephila clavipes]
MYKNALKEDLIRVVKELDGTVESTDTIVKLKTKIENSSTFESDPDFVKTLIQNCIDERVSQNERETVCVAPKDLFEPWQWKRRKKRNRFEQTSRTLQRKISMRSTKDQLVKKDVLMPVKQCVFLWNLPDVEEVPSHSPSGLRGSTAADSVRSEWPLWHAAKSKAVFARRRNELKLKLVN